MCSSEIFCVVSELFLPDSWCVQYAWYPDSWRQHSLLAIIISHVGTTIIDQEGRILCPISGFELLNLQSNRADKLVNKQVIHGELVQNAQ